MLQYCCVFTLWVVLMAGFIIQRVDYTRSSITSIVDFKDGDVLFLFLFCFLFCFVFPPEVYLVKELCCQHRKLSALFALVDTNCPIDCM